MYAFATNRTGTPGIVSVFFSTDGKKTALVLTFLYKCNRFIKTGSGQTLGKINQNVPGFARAAHLDAEDRG